MDLECTTPILHFAQMTRARQQLPIGFFVPVASCVMPVAFFMDCRKDRRDLLLPWCGRSI
jgi:hypothetical protein